MTFLLTGLLLLMVPWSFSAPLADPTYISWQKSPNIRGTWDLLISCTFTLVISVYTTVHLNLPGDEPRCWWCRIWWRLRKPRWIATGILAPEVVVYTAWCQWVSARALTNEMRSIMNKRQEKGLRLPRHEWTIIHSFVAGMGGFVLDMDQDEWERLHLPGSFRLALTAKGILQLASLGYDLPDVPLQSIRDQSKADTFTKSIACLQAGYLIFQMAGRLGSRLSITLLEVNAVGHALCAMIIFWFWLRKPYDIRSPIPVAGTWVRAVRTFWSLENPCEMSDCTHENGTSSARPRRDRENFKNFICLADKMAKIRAASIVNGSTRPFSHENGENLGGDTDSFVETSDGTPFWKKEPRQGPLFFDRMPTEEERNSRRHFVDFPIVIVESAANKTNSDLEAEFSSSFLWSGITHVYRTTLRPVENSTPISCLGDSYDGLHWFDDGTLERWGLAAAALELERDCPHAAHQSTSECLVPRVQNFPYKNGLLPPSPECPIEVSIALSSALYGGVHMSQWFSHFPSPAEATLWRWSTVIIAASGVTASLALIAQRVVDSLAKVFAKAGDSSIVSNMTEDAKEIVRKHATDSSSKKSILKVYLACTGIMLFGCLYLPARCFVIVEAFISLRSLPGDAYITPEWSQWIPHI